MFVGLSSTGFAMDGETTFRSGSNAITLSSTEMELFKLAVENIESQRNAERAGGLLGSSQDRAPAEYKGEILVDGMAVNYHAKDGTIDYYTSRGRPIASIPAREIFDIVSQYSREEAAERCPWCIGALVGVIVNGILCSGGEAASAAYCNAACQCGVQSYSSVCVMGSRQVSCQCMECPEPPDPGNLFPVSGSWAGPLVPGVPWVQDPGGMLVIPDPY